LISSASAKATAEHSRLSASLAPSFALRASEGHCRRGAFTLSQPNVPIYPELVEGPAAPPLFFARAIFSPFGRVEKEFVVFLAPPTRARKTFLLPLF